MKKKVAALTSAIMTLSAQAHGQGTDDFTRIFGNAFTRWNTQAQEGRIATSDMKAIADNFIAFQNADGGWPKNIDWLSSAPADSVRSALSERYKQSTLDNKNVYPQIEYLSLAYTKTGDSRYRDAALRATDYILSNQKSNGGWRGWDVDAITFNDNVMNGVLKTLHNIALGRTPYQWMSRKLRRKALKAFERGVDVTLRCQIRQDGCLTAWCQQHDNATLKPVGARAFELPCITAGESEGIVHMLMDISDPSDEIKDAIEGAVNWFRKVAIKGIRIERVPLPPEKVEVPQRPYDRIVVEDPAAPPIWARYYDVDDNTPFFCNRDGIKVYKLSDVKMERRTGYAWYGYWPQSVLDRYPKWKAATDKHGQRKNR